MFTLSEVASAVNGRIVNRGGDGEIVITGVNKDTRTVKNGDIYVALVGERFDGHAFCQDALNKGASCVLVSKEEAIPEGSVGVLVEDTLKALGDLARHYRFKIGAKVVAVTGSVGKTTTREMIACALRGTYRVCSTKSNQNNEIGLPMTILEAPADTEILVLEMGMRLRGEISYLTNIACPDVAVITNVGYCHIERLGSREEIRLAKLEILEGLTEGGTLVVNGDDNYLSNFAANTICPGNFLVTVNTTDSKVPNNVVSSLKANNIKYNGNGMSFDTDAVTGISLAVNGVHNVRNALVALMCCKLTGADVKAGAAALGEYTEMAGRGEVVETKKFTVINDAYNASPESMEAAFDNLDLIGGGKRKVAVLGGILELGDYAPMLHEKVGEACGKHKFDVTYVTGDNKADFVKGYRSVNPDGVIVECENTADVKNKLVADVKEGDVMLFKASHAFEYEKLASEMATMGEE